MRSARKARRKQKGCRPQRFPLHAPVRYRAGAGDWHHGTSESISRSGLLLHVDEPLEPNTAIEMIVELPAVLGEDPAHVVCRGRVVRMVATPETTGAMLAAAIDRYKISRT